MQALNSQEKIPWNCNLIPQARRSNSSLSSALLTVLQNHAKIIAFIDGAVLLHVQQHFVTDPIAKIPKGFRVAGFLVCDLSRMCFRWLTTSFIVV